MLLLDTAGLRKDTKREGLERIFAQHAQRAITQCNIAIVLLRLDEGLTEQDARLLRVVYEEAQGMIILLTQSDRLHGAEKTRAYNAIDEKLSLRYPSIDMIQFSVKDPAAFKKLQRSVLSAAKSLSVELTSARLTRVLEGLLASVPPPCTAVSRIKPRFAHPGNDFGTIMVRGKQVEALPLSYRRYLEKGFMEALNLVNRPMRVVLKNDHNPYATETHA
jgi:GTP-binding protein